MLLSQHFHIGKVRISAKHRMIAKDQISHSVTGSSMRSNEKSKFLSLDDLDDLDDLDALRRLRLCLGLA